MSHHINQNHGNQPFLTPKLWLSSRTLHQHAYRVSKARSSPLLWLARSKVVLCLRTNCVQSASLQTAVHVHRHTRRCNWNKEF